MAFIDTLTPKQIAILLEKVAPGKDIDDPKKFLGDAFEDDDLKGFLRDAGVKAIAGKKESFASPGGASGGLMPKVKAEKIERFVPPEERGGKKKVQKEKGVHTEVAPALPPEPEADKADSKLLTLKVVPPQGFRWQDYVPNKERDSDLQGFEDRPEYFNAINLFNKTGQNLMMIGEAGSGKSTIGKWYAYQRNFPYLAISADGLLGVKELFGLPSISEGTSYFVEGLFTTFTQIGWKKVYETDPTTGKVTYKLVDDPDQPGAIILIDEVTALDPSKNFIFHQILAERKFFVRDANKTYYVAPRVMIMFAGNPKDPRYPGVGKMNLAFADRMGTILLEPLGIASIEKILRDEKKGFGKLLKDEQFKFIISYVVKMRDFIKSGDEPLPAELSMRSIKRIASFMASGASRMQAVELGFLNTYVAHDKDTYEALRGHSVSIVKE